MIQRLMIRVITVAQALLLGYELIARYDTTGRQVALAMTNAAVVGLFFLVSRFLARRYGMSIHWSVLLVMAASVWLDAVGNFLHFYAQYWWWDRLTHAAGGMAATVSILWVTVALWRVGRLPVSWLVVNLYAFCLAQTLGAMYEASEWLGDILFSTHRVQGPFDTPRDLGFNMVGGLAAVLIARWWRIRNRSVEHGRR